MENVNIFGEQGEIGSLDKNLVLRTRGLVYIRFGKKYVELLDGNGNLNVKVPKVIKKIKSNKEVLDDGFYILDDSVYAYFDGELILITGIEGQFVSYAIELDLSQELIAQALRNIGIKFKSLSDALQCVKEGIVFIGNKIYYINNGLVSEIFNELLTSLNESGLTVPDKDNYCISWKEGRWIFLKFATYLELEALNIPENKESEEYYDYIEYSKRYKILDYSLINNTNNEDLIKGIKEIASVPVIEQVTDDILIVTLELNVVDDLDTFTNKNNTYTGLTLLKDTNGKEIKLLVILNFEYVFSNGVDNLYFIDEYGDRFNILFRRARLFDSISSYKTGGTVNFDDYKKYGKEVGCIMLGNVSYIIRDTLETLFKNRNVYVKAEDSSEYKFKIDYKNAEIALEENYPIRDYNDHLDLNPHVVLGDLYDSLGYYNNPPIPFKTYYDNTNTHGLFSDSNVFIGGEFRHPLDKLLSRLLVPQDIYYYHFPRYSKNLTKGMTLSIFNHDEIILPKKWVPLAANYIEDLTAYSGTLESRDDNLYDGKLFLYKVTGTSGNSITASFHLSPQYDKNGNIINTRSFGPYTFYDRGTAVKENDYKLNTILLAQYKNGQINVLRNPGLITIESEGNVIEIEPKFDTINFKGSTYVGFTVSKSSKTINVKVNITQALENRLTAIENDITNIKSDIRDIKGDISDIKDDITDIENRLSDIEDRLTDVEGGSSNEGE